MRGPCAAVRKFLAIRRRAPSIFTAQHMNLLAIDTAAQFCAVCVHDGAAGVERGRSVRDIGKGHAEQLMEVIDEALAAGGVAYADIGGVAVSVGPGSFTGIRVGVAAARGLALGLGIPSAGVTTLEALALAARDLFPDRPVVAALDAKRDEIYVAAFAADGTEHAAPRIASLAEVVAMAGPGTVLCGTAVPLIEAATGQRFDTGPVAATADISAYARIVARRGFTQDRPRPLYLRGADAKPQTGFALPRKG